jgi:hypothetical protein
VLGIDKDDDSYSLVFGDAALCGVLDMFRITGTKRKIPNMSDFVCSRSKCLGDGVMDRLVGESNVQSMPGSIQRMKSTSFLLTHIPGISLALQKSDYSSEVRFSALRRRSIVWALFWQQALPYFDTLVSKLFATDELAVAEWDIVADGLAFRIRTANPEIQASLIAASREASSQSSPFRLQVLQSNEFEFASTSPIVLAVHWARPPAWSPARAR